MQGSQSPSLSANGIAARRGDRLLFRGLSMELGAGEALHITGANGTGKTTLIRALAGLLTPFAGTVERKGALGLLDERIGLDPDQPLGKALAFWAKIDLESAVMFEGYCERLALNNLLEVPVRYLSTGQRKRAALARLMIQGPDIWLLDEPLSGLDAASQALVRELVREQCGYAGIVIFASHQELAIEGLKTLALEDFAPAPEAFGEMAE